MTIHKAKGLEFDTVILPGLGERAARRRSKTVALAEQGGELLLAPIKEAGQRCGSALSILSSHLEDSKEEHETARLLYVAATRARRNLHLTGVRESESATARSANRASGSFLKLLWPMVSRNSS